MYKGELLNHYRITNLPIIVPYLNSSIEVHCVQEGRKINVREWISGCGVTGMARIGVIRDTKRFCNRGIYPKVGVRLVR